MNLFNQHPKKRLSGVNITQKKLLLPGQKITQKQGRHKKFR
jgi:hypothetical protein